MRWYICKEEGVPLLDCMWRYAAGKYDFPLLGDYPIIAGIRLLFLCRKKKYRKEVRVETENFVIVCHNLLFYLYLYHSL